jgi:hypothetical protein
VVKNVAAQLLEVKKLVHLLHYDEKKAKIPHAPFSPCLILTKIR